MNVKCLTRCSGYLLSLGLLVATAGCGGVYDLDPRGGSCRLTANHYRAGAVTFHPVSGGPAAYGMIGEDERAIPFKRAEVKVYPLVTIK